MENVEVIDNVNNVVGEVISTEAPRTTLLRKKSLHAYEFHVRVIQLIIAVDFFDAKI